MSDTKNKSAAKTIGAEAAGTNVKTATPKTAEAKEEGWGEFLRTVAFAVLIALAFRTIAYEPFNIPSESMLPNLLVGDYLLVSKYSYGYSKHSMPLSPGVFSGRVFEKPVTRGDIAVFKFPGDNSTDYIKRIVGLPGDTIQVIRGHLYINNDPVKRERIEDFKHPDNGLRYPQYRETLRNGVTFRTLDCRYNAFGVVASIVELNCAPKTTDNFGPHVVPQGHYFAMGDNRDNSTDSRVSRSRGGVDDIPAENLVGRAEVIFFSTYGARMWEFWKWFQAARFERFFSSLR